MLVSKSVSSSGSSSSANLSSATDSSLSANSQVSGESLSKDNSNAEPTNKKLKPPVLSEFGYTFANEALLTRALTHKSFFNENSEKCAGHNETLEFLGDSVLDLALSDLLMSAHPDWDEGELSKIRASLVNERGLSEMCKEIQLEDHLKFGKGERNSGGAEKPRLLASAFEALIGALFLDSTYEKAREIVRAIFSSRLESLDREMLYDQDYKTRFQEKIQRERKITPEYVLKGAVGPDHEKEFFVDLLISDQLIASGKGRSKKQAEQEAARAGLEASI